MATLIKASGEQLTLDLPARLADVSALIGCAYVEPIWLPAGGLLLVDEEGVLRGRPRNEAASVIAGQPIVGDVIHTTRREFGRVK